MQTVPPTHSAPRPQQRVALIVQAVPIATELMLHALNVQVGKHSQGSPALIVHPILSHWEELQLLALPAAPTAALPAIQLLETASFAVLVRG